MTVINKILVAIDLTDESAEVFEKALIHANQYNAELSLIHVLEPLSYAYGGDIPMDLSEVQQELDKQAQHALNKYASKANIPADRCYIPIGKPDTEIHRVANEIECDMIVIGSHGKHGLQLLLGSTANAVLHGAHCDVLAIRIKDKK